MVDVRIVISSDLDDVHFDGDVTRLSTDFGAEELESLGGDVLAVAGDDHFVACVASAYDGLISPLPTGSDGMVAQQVHSGSSLDRVLKRLAKGKFEEIELGTLRVTDTHETSSITGFSFGAGTIERAFEARERVEKDAGFDQIVKGLSAASSNLKKDNARLSVDWSLLEDGRSWIHASTLERSWLRTRISADGAARFLSGDNILEWLSHATRLARWVGGGDEARTFDAIHIDADTGYVVDGRRFSRCPRVIQVRPGRRIRVAALT